MAVTDEMNISQRASYLKGLADGLDLDKSKPEGKLIDAMLDLIYEITEEIGYVQEDVELLMNDDDFEFDDEDYYDDDMPEYEVKCPDCGAEVAVDEDTLIEGEINCPDCGRILEFDFSNFFDDDKDESEDLPF